MGCKYHASIVNKYGGTAQFACVIYSLYVYHVMGVVTTCGLCHLWFCELICDVMGIVTTCGLTVALGSLAVHLLHVSVCVVTFT